MLDAQQEDEQDETEYLLPVVDTPGRQSLEISSVPDSVSRLAHIKAHKWDILAISTVYIIEGFTDLAGTAVQYFLKDNLLLEPAQAGLAYTVALMPWNMTPLLGILTDTIPIFGYTRKAYLLIVGLAGCLSWLVLPGVTHVVPATLLVLVGNACSAWSQVVADAVTVKLSQKQSMDVAAFFQSLSWVTYTCGAVAGGFLAGAVLETHGALPVFYITSGCMLIVSACALIMCEPKRQTQPASPFAYSSSPASSLLTGSNKLHGSRPPSHGGRIAALAARVKAAVGLVAGLLGQVWHTVRQPHIFGSALFVFTWQATPSPTSAFFYFQTNQLGFSPEFMQFMYLCGSLSGFTGVLIYNLFLVRHSLRGVLCCCAVLGSLLNASQLLLVSRVNLQLGLSDKLFSLGDYSMLSVLAEVMLTPMLALASRACPEGVEATLSATFYSLLNMSRAVSSAGGAGLTAAFGITQTDFSHLFGLTLLCNVFMLLPLPLLLLMPKGNGIPGSESDAAAADEDEDEGHAEHSPLIHRDGGVSRQGSRGLRVDDEDAARMRLLEP